MTLGRANRRRLFLVLAVVTNSEAAFQPCHVAEGLKSLLPSSHRLNLDCLIWWLQHIILQKKPIDLQVLKPKFKTAY